MLRSLFSGLALLSLSFCTISSGTGSEKIPEPESSDESPIESSTQFDQNTPVKCDTCAKFEPSDGIKLLFIGQDMISIGGIDLGEAKKAAANTLVDIDTDTSGYIDDPDLKVPAGIVSYTGVKSVDGLLDFGDWDAGITNADFQLSSTVFDNTAMAIGFDLNKTHKRIPAGRYDSSLDALITFFKKHSDHPVFLRIGYEFDGQWNRPSEKSSPTDDDATEYVEAYKYIKDYIQNSNVSNVAYVWQSTGHESSTTLNKFYPGDTYVDWCAFSHFNSSAGKKMIAFADSVNKPLMIAESTPRGDDIRTSPGAVESYLYSLLSLVNSHQRIKALCYINANWTEQKMWPQVDPDNFGITDSRIQADADIKQFWINEVSQPQWIHAYPGLLDDLRL